MESKKLYEITGAFAAAAAAAFDAETEEEYEEFSKELDACTAQLTEKATATAQILRNLQGKLELQKAAAQNFKSEYERLNAKANATAAAIDRLKEYVLFSMQCGEMDKIKTDVGTWYTQRTVSASITDEWEVADALPQFAEPQPPKIKKAEIIKYYKQFKKEHPDAGFYIPGVEMTETTGIRFR